MMYPTSSGFPGQTAARPKPSSGMPSKPAAAPAPAAPAPEEPIIPVPSDVFPRPAANWLEVQIELARRGISCGSIDGVAGPQSVAALRAFQENEYLPVTGQLDPDTCARLTLSSPPFAPMTLTAQNLADLQPLSPTWLGKSQQTTLAFETTLELVAERTHAHPALIRRLNPAVDWAAITPATPLMAPAVGRASVPAKAVQLHRCKLHP